MVIDVSLNSIFFLVKILLLIICSLTLGSICENRSRTPETPKSGEVELQTAPEEDDDEDNDIVDDDDDDDDEWLWWLWSCMMIMIMFLWRVEIMIMTVMTKVIMNWGQPSFT